MRQIKLITYNIDGLPEKIDLNKLPWIFKPIAWIYKLIKGTTIISINDNYNKALSTEHISECLLNSNADIIGVQEDFYYHNELMKYLSNYDHGKCSNLSSIWKNIRLFPYPHFKIDGLNILVKNDSIRINKEEIVKWKKSYGYFTHANDKITNKGFRFYSLTIDNIIDIDVYVLHMDADFYHPEKCPDVSKDLNARKHQFNQLINYIKNKKRNNPIIIMGDTNSYERYSWDVDNVNEFIEKINEIPSLTIQEATPNEDVDKIFYINNDQSPYKFKLIECYYDKNFKDDMGNLSDHYPFIATFNIIKTL